ncbi:retrovirus-related pol polyprotein from transposon TNT 1-94 [Tanacetum coccineum]
MFMLNSEPLAPRLLQNREAHIDYLKYTQEQAYILWEIVKQAKVKQPLDKELYFACKHAQRIQELLVYVQDTCPNAIKLSAKMVVVTPNNNVKKVRFVEPLTSSSNIKQVKSSKTSDSNTPVLSPIGLKCSTSNCGSKLTCNKKNDRISRTPSRNMKNKVEAQPRKVNKKNRVVEPICDVDVKHSLLKVNFKIICATCKKSMFDGVHDMCSSKKAKIVESTNANLSEPNHTWGSNAIDIPSSSSIVMTACALGKSKKSSHQPKAKDTNQEKLYLLHMELCGPMRVASINGKSLLHPNRSLIRLRYNKTLYELMQDKKPDLSFFHVFGALCYPTNDNDELGKLDTKVDIGIFVGYATAKKAFRIYNKRTRKIIETIHVTFDELIAMASKQFSSGLGLHSLTPATSSSGLVPNHILQQPCIPPPRDDWDRLFQPMFDEYFTPPLIDVSVVQEAVAPRAVV